MKSRCRSWRNSAGVALSFLVFTGTACRDIHTPHAEECVYPLGDLRLSRECMECEVVSVGRVYTDTVWIYNPAADSCLVRPDYSGGLECCLPGGKIPPGACVPMIVSLRKSTREGLGSFFEVIRFRLNDGVDDAGWLIVRGWLVEDFEGDGRGQECPEVCVADDSCDFGTIAPGDVARVGFWLTNQGKGNLIIRQIECGCGCLQSVTPRREMAPDERLLLEFDFRASDREGRQQRTIALICNDPARPVVKLSVTGHIKKDSK